MRLRTLALSLLMLPGLLLACSSREPLRSLVDEVVLPDSLVELNRDRFAYAPGGPEFEITVFEVPNSVLGGKTAIAWFCDQRAEHPDTVDPQFASERMGRECSKKLSLDSSLDQIYVGQSGARVLLRISGFVTAPSHLKVEARYVEKFDDPSSWD